MAKAAEGADAGFSVIAERAQSIKQSLLAQRHEVEQARP
jgi:hypothetical protein